MNIEEKIKRILFSICGEENISVDARLQDDLLLDSLCMVTLLIELENSFEIELDESDMNPFDLVTVKDVIRLVKRYFGECDEEKE